MTKLNPKLPTGDANGLGAAEEFLVENATSKHVIVAVVEVEKVSTNPRTARREPTVRILRTEVMTGISTQAASNALNNEADLRLGRTPLPIDLGETP